MIEFDDRYRLDGFDIKVLEEIYQYLTNRDIELIFTDSKEIQNINKNFRQIDKPTDVLSFPLDFMPNMPLGSVVINIDFVKNKSLEFNHDIESEIKLLFIHGLLHLLGYDHENDNGEMRQKEREIIEKFSLPQSLIVRSEDK